MADETAEKIKQLTTSMLTESHIDEMTVKWLSQTPNPPRIPEFYTLTKIHKPTLVGRPNIWMWRPHRENFILSRPPHTADNTTTGILSERFERFYKLPRNTILASKDITSFKKKGSRLYGKHTKTSIKTIYQTPLSS